MQGKVGVSYNPYMLENQVPVGKTLAPCDRKYKYVSETEVFRWEMGTLAALLAALQGVMLKPVRSAQTQLSTNAIPKP